MSLLKFLNVFLLQWFFIRLARTGDFFDGQYIQSGWTVIGFILPCTGWFSDYIYIWNFNK